MEHRKTLWLRLPIIIRAVIGGLLIGMIAANIWPILLVTMAAACRLPQSPKSLFWGCTYGGRPAMVSRALQIDARLLLPGPPAFPGTMVLGRWLRR